MTLTTPTSLQLEFSVLALQDDPLPSLHAHCIQQSGQPSNHYLTPYIYAVMPRVLSVISVHYTVTWQTWLTL